MSGREFTRLTLEQTLELLQKPQPTCILFHVNPDADAIGSAFALAELLRLHGSPAYCLCAHEIPDRLRFLTDGLQESVLLPSLPKEFDEARVITVDSAAPTQLGALYDHFGDRISLMIDHHEKGTPYADHLILPDAAATGEIVFDLISISGVEVSARCSALLYAAISSDTGGFRYSNTTRETHLRAAVLVSDGVDVADISHRLFETKSMQMLCAEHIGFESMRLFDEGRVALISIGYEQAEKHSLLPEHFATLVDVARSVAGVEVAAVIRQPEQAPRFRVSMRANVDVDVAAVAERFGGGGHRRAAGATILAPSIEEAERVLLEALLQK